MFQLGLKRYSADKWPSRLSMAQKEPSWLLYEAGAQVIQN